MTPSQPDGSTWTWACGSGQSARGPRGAAGVRSRFTAHTSNSKHTHVGPKSTSDPSFLAGDVKVIFLKLPLPSSLLHYARVLLASSCFSSPKPSPLAPTFPSHPLHLQIGPSPLSVRTMPEILSSCSPSPGFSSSMC